MLDVLHLYHVLRRLAPEKLKPRDITGVIVDIANQIGVMAPKAKRIDVRLPLLVRRRALEEPGTSDIAMPLLGWGRHER